MFSNYGWNKALLVQCIVSKFAIDSSECCKIPALQSETPILGRLLVDHNWISNNGGVSSSGLQTLSGLHKLELQCCGHNDVVSATDKSIFLPNRHISSAY